MSSSIGFTPLAISQTTFLGLVWGSTWVSFVFLVMRGYLRLKAFRRLFADDALVFLAWLILFITAIVWQVRVYIIYYVWNISDGLHAPPPDLFEKVEMQVHQGLAITILNFVSLWCIKFAFLLLFKKMNRNVNGQQILWWSVFFFTVATLIVSIGIQAYDCVFGDIVKISAKCSQPEKGRYIYAILRVQAGVDVASDALITIIPINLLWGVQISTRLKAELGLIFSLTLFTMITAVVKVVVTLQGPREDDSWLFSWSAIESASAIIIACLVSYRASWKKERKSKKYINGTSAYPLRETRSSLSAEVRTNGSSTQADAVDETPLSGPNAIHVKQEYMVDSRLNRRDDAV